jgi:hypothetical protein
MAYPSFEQYNQALQQPRLLADAELQRGTVTTTGLGLPLAISGGFALTYTIETGAKKYAVRCFHRESKSLELRYDAISRRLAGIHSHYFLDFKFQPQGIKIDGEYYPIVKMAWAKGATLGEFLDANWNNRSALTKLSDSLASMATYLEREHIAHGDLQTGNIMVSAGGSVIQLIDYDGIYVDEIKRLGSAELGHVNFQHPQRKTLNPFNPGLDRFSLIALAIALKALRTEPSLWHQTNSEMDAILFRANDFVDPGSSQVFAMLSSHAALRQDIADFAAVCKAPMEQTPSLTDFLSGRHIPALRISLTGGTARSNAHRDRYISAYQVLPATNFTVCMKHVGDKVEVIGRIFEVTEEKKARNGKPYVFINFGDWRGKIFKVSVWSEGLAALNGSLDASWVGKWLSVVGLMQPVYKNPKFKYWHLSIEITTVGQMSVISEADAQWRLTEPSAENNQEILRKISHKQFAKHEPRPNATPASSSISSNLAVMEKIRAATTHQHTLPSVQGGHIRTSHPPSQILTVQPVNTTPDQSPSPNKKNLLKRFFNRLFD